MSLDITQVPDGTARANADIACHCRQVTYEEIRTAVRDDRARTLADVQLATDACTRCFGCRFDVEGVLREELGDKYVATTTVTREPQVRRGPVHRLRAWWAPRRRSSAETLSPVRKMYLPIFEGLGASQVTTRLVLFNLPDESAGRAKPVDVRADVTRLDGTREDVWRTAVAPRQTSVLDVNTMLHPGALPEGVGMVRLVVDAASVASLRPYFHLITPNGITSTHEKSAPRKPQKRGPRNYHWVYPLAPKARKEEAYFFLINTHEVPLDGHRLAYRDVDSHEESVEVPRLELDQGACVALHEHFPAVREGRATGTVRLTPSVHVAGWILHRDVEADLWRVQHL